MNYCFSLKISGLLFKDAPLEIISFVSKVAFTPRPIILILKYINQKTLNILQLF